MTSDEPGTPFVLHATDLGSLAVGSPVFFRRLPVGRIAGYEVQKEGKEMAITVFIQAPYDRFVRTDSIFWHASGIEVSMSTGGVKVSTESWISLLVGGIAFESDGEEGGKRQAAPNAEFPLFANKEEAMKRPATAQPFMLVFTRSIRGLYIGAPVDFRGVRIGEVTGIDLHYDQGSKQFQIPVRIRVYTERFRPRSPGDTGYDPGASRAFMDELVARGLRATLGSGNLLTGQLYVELEFMPDAPKARIDWTKDPPAFPLAGGKQQELESTLTRIARKVDKIPIEELSADVRRAVQSLDRTLRDTDRLVKKVETDVTPEVAATLEAARNTLGYAKGVLSSGSPMQQEMRDTLRELGRAARAVRDLADYLERNPESLIRGKRRDGK